MLYDSLCKFFGEKSDWQPQLSQEENRLIRINKYSSVTRLVAEATEHVYSIKNDSDLLKSKCELDQIKLAEAFDLIRKEYKLRREFNNYKISINNLTEDIETVISGLRFRY